MDPRGGVGFSNCSPFTRKFVYSPSGSFSQWAFGGKGALASGSVVQTPALLPNCLLRCRTDVGIPEVSSPVFHISKV